MIMILFICLVLNDTRYAPLKPKESSRKDPELYRVLERRRSVNDQPIIDSRHQPITRGITRLFIAYFFKKIINSADNNDIPYQETHKVPAASPSVMQVHGKSLVTKYINALDKIRNTLGTSDSATANPSDDPKSSIEDRIVLQLLNRASKTIQEMTALDKDLMDKQFYDYKLKIIKLIDKYQSDIYRARDLDDKRTDPEVNHLNDYKNNLCKRAARAKVIIDTFRSPNNKEELSEENQQKVHDLVQETAEESTDEGIMKHTASSSASPSSPTIVIVKPQHLTDNIVTKSEWTTKDFEDNIKELNETYSKIQKIIEENYKLQILVLENNFKGELEKEHGELEKEHTTNNKLNEELDDLRKKLQESEQINANLEQANSDNKKTQAKIGGLHRKLQEAQAKTEAKDQELQEAQAKTEASNTEINKLLEQAIDLQSVISTITKEIEQLQEDLIRAHQKTSSESEKRMHFIRNANGAVSEVIRLQGKLNQAFREHAEDTRRFNADQDQEELAKTITELRQELEKESTANNELKTDLNKLSAERDKLIAERDKVIAELNDLRKQIQDLKGSFATAQKELVQKKDHLNTSLESSLRVMNNSRDALALTSKIKELEKQVQDRQDQLSNKNTHLQQVLVDLEISNRQLEKSQGEMYDLRRRHTDEINSLKEKISRFEEVITQLRNAHEQALKEKADALSAMGQLKASNEKAEQRHASDLKKLRAQLQEAIEEKEGLEEQLAEHKTEQANSEPKLREDNFKLTEQLAGALEASQPQRKTSSEPDPEASLPPSTDSDSDSTGQSFKSLRTQPDQIVNKVDVGTDTIVPQTSHAATQTQGSETKVLQSSSSQSTQTAVDDEVLRWYQKAAVTDANRSSVSIPLVEINLSPQADAATQTEAAVAVDDESVLLMNLIKEFTDAGLSAPDKTIMAAPLAHPVSPPSIVLQPLAQNRYYRTSRNIPPARIIPTPALASARSVTTTTLALPNNVAPQNNNNFVILTVLELSLLTMLYLITHVTILHLANNNPRFKIK